MITTTELFTTEHAADTLIIVPASDLSGLAYQPLDVGAGELLLALEDASVKNVIVDLYRTDYFGSSALECFIRLWKRVAERHGHMVLCNVSETEKEILQTMRLDHLWPICRSRAEAMRNLCA